MLLYLTPACFFCVVVGYAADNKQVLSSPQRDVTSVSTIAPCFSKAGLVIIGSHIPWDSDTIVLSTQEQNIPD